ncbi:hypothetical protein QJL37_00645 [Clostridioides difficile]|nr:hypothetical protein [Clostridioides difficile]EQE08861.1 hypothetical protein QAU_2993 [Clostridioides difficile CD13]EQF82597.1 hypothetical protein QGC_0829 [Clostridioides difficile CD196]EGT3862896.1 hypothetical protein [Clostridioides difficile]EGT4121265.1 hypothetical protein [Clostridioides difficile]EGT4548255.1 hypothetical protein [Clostridioides difficile]
MWCVKELVEYKNLKSEFSIILTKWYVNSNIKDFTSLPSIGFILTMWYVKKELLRRMLLAGEILY